MIMNTNSVELPIGYYTYKAHTYQCSHCAWQGLGSELRQGEMFEELFELNCPTCGEEVTFIMYPSVREAIANGAAVSDADRQEMEEMQRFWAKCAEMELKSPDQLPDIASSAFTIVWDKVDDMTVLRYRDTVIFTEVALYEGFERYQEVGLILKQKYGKALRDLEPTFASAIFLYGDNIFSVERTQKFRQQAFDARGLPAWLD
jgi:hypothetical protein